MATDIDNKPVDFNCKYETLDVTDKQKFEDLVKTNKIDCIVHQAAILSALGEKVPDLAIDVNIQGTVYAMNIARDHKC